MRLRLAPTSHNQSWRRADATKRLPRPRDPIALAKPWHNTLTFKRSRDQNLLEFVCAENDRNPVDEAGHTGFN